MENLNITTLVKDRTESGTNSVAVSSDAYAFIANIARITGRTMKDVATQMVEFAAKHTKVAVELVEEEEGEQ